MKTIPLLKFLKGLKVNKRSSNVANLSYGKSKPKGNKFKKCTICNKIGHTEQQCWHNKANNQHNKHNNNKTKNNKNNNKTKRSNKAYSAETTKERDSQDEYQQSFINDYESSDEEQSNLVMTKTMKPRQSAKNKNKKHKGMQFSH